MPIAFYGLLQQQMKSLTDGVPHRTANLANASALLFNSMADVNWVGFYLLEDDKLVLGPFQGKPACIEIPVGKGVCGSCVAQDAPIVVPNVHAFPGHIACDVESNSEMVLPLHVNGKVVGVLDIDSPVLNRFTEMDRIGVQVLVPVLENILAR